MSNLSGVCVPVCTVFDDNGAQVSETRYLAHVDRMLEAGVDIILPCGGTGEFAYLSMEEKACMETLCIKLFFKIKKKKQE
jgi:4-hydroxy-tetrahydrodipicolinate synthase